MNAELNRRALEVFDAVVDLPAAEQAARIDALCASDALLHARVVALLQADIRDSEPFTGDAARWSQAMARASESAAEAQRAGKVIGAWRVVATLGHGGMGTVYEVERSDGAYQQRAALKLIRGAADSPAARERFLRERQALARLQHPNVATLLDGGFTAEGDPWFVMEYVDGIAIDQWCDQHQLDVRARIELFLQALSAVQYAHRNLIVHRDLKPSNLLVDSQGRVKLLDFGIAKELANVQATVTSDRALTFAYASPEQLRNLPITTATDLWQLGIVLHRLLSGAHPFRLEPETPLAQQLPLLEGEPEPLTKAALRADAEQVERRGCANPAALARQLRGDLSHIVQGCLQREASARYPSVEALADDLRRWREKRPLRISPPGSVAIARLWLRRNRLLATATLAFAVAVLVGAGVSLWQAHIARAQARIAETENARARAAMKFLTETFAAAAPEKSLNTTVSVQFLLDNAHEALQRPGAIDPTMRQPVQRMLARLYASLNDDANAAALFATGIPGEAPQSREEALALADDLVVYSDVLGMMEDYPQALATADRAAQLRRQFAPDDPEQQLRALAHQTLAHLQKHGADACEKQSRQALELASRMTNPPLDVVIDVYNDLAALADYRDAGAGALAVSEEGLAYADRHGVAPESPLRATLQRFKVQALNQLGRPADAESIVRAAIAAVEKTGGAGNTRLGVLYATLGETLMEQGRYREALEVLTRGEQLLPSADLGPRNQATALGNRAFLNMQLGDYRQALRLAEQSMAVMDEAGVPVDDQFRRDNQRNYARILAANDKLAQARDLLLDLRERALRLEPGNWQEQVRLARSLVTVLQRLGDVDAGDSLLADTRKLFQAQGVAATDVAFAPLLRAEAGFARAHGDLAAAERLSREAGQLLASGANRTEAAIAEAELADILAARGDNAGAHQLLGQALPTLRNAVMPLETNRAAAEALEKRLATTARLDAVRGGR